MAYLRVCWVWAVAECSFCSCAGTIPAGSPAALETLSLTRNFLSGSTSMLRLATSLKTLILSSNYLSCDSVRLDDAAGLGVGKFYNPTSLALYNFGASAVTIINQQQTAFLEAQAPSLLNVLGRDFEWVTNGYSNTSVSIDNVVSYKLAKELTISLPLVLIH